MSSYRDYLYKLRIYIYTLGALFVVSILFGYFSIMYYPEYGQILEETLREFEGITELSNFKLFLFIFLNNSIKVFFTIILGVFFGIVPVLMIFLNGYFIGGIIYTILSRNSWEVIVAGILPHGIIEVPVFLLAASIGLMLGGRFVQNLFKVDSNDNLSLKDNIKYAIKVYFTAIAPLLLLAALIESYITPVILASF